MPLGGAWGGVGLPETKSGNVTNGKVKGNSTTQLEPPTKNPWPDT